MPILCSQTALSPPSILRKLQMFTKPRKLCEWQAALSFGVGHLCPQMFQLCHLQLLFCFPTEQMSDLSTRGRIYCSYGAIEPAAIKAELPELSMEDKSIVSAIMQRKAEVQAAKNPWQEWQKKND